MCIGYEDVGGVHTPPTFYVFKILPPIANCIMDVQRTHKPGLIVILVLLLLVRLVSASLADDIVTPLLDVICNLYCAVSKIALFVASVVVVLAGIKWVASGDDPGGRKAAKDTIIFVIVGLIVIAIAATIVSGVIGSNPCEDAGFTCT